MRLQRQLILGLLLIFSGIGLVIFLVLSQIVLPRIENLERDTLRQGLQRAEKRLQQEQRRLSGFAEDWGVWNDTYDYLLQPGEAYRRSNLVQSSLNSTESDLLLLIAADGTRAAKLMRETLPEQDVIEQFAPAVLAGTHPLRQLAPGQQGMLKLGSGVFLFGSSPILTSQGEGPALGTVVFLKKVDRQFELKVARQLEQDIKLAPVPWGAGRASGPEIRFIGDDRSLAHTWLPLLNSSEHRLGIQLQQPRPFYMQAQETISFAVLTLLSAGLLLSLLAYFYLRARLVSPILQIQRQAEEYGSTHRLDAVIPLARNDELGRLSLAFTRMAQSLEHHRSRLEMERQQYLDASYTDPLTGLRNRRYLEQCWRNRQERTGETAWLFMFLDLDHFKQVNDRYGHDVGDMALQQFSRMLEQYSRSSDIAVRFGGEEFMLFCEGADEQVACGIAARIRDEVANFSFGKPEQPIHLTCSIGFFAVTRDCSISGANAWDRFVKVADLALYAAKTNGRNSWIGLKCADSGCAASCPERPEQLVAKLNQRQLLLFSSLAPSQDIVWDSPRA